LEDPVAASTYVAQGDLTNVIEASFVNPGYSETLLVYEKQFIARFEDLDVYFLLAGNPGISATTAPGGIVFNAVKLKDLSIVFEQTTLTLTDAGNAYTQSDLVDVTTIPPGQTITWSSSDENVATVDADGNVTVLSGGNVNISGTLATGEAASYKLNTRETIALASYYQHTLAVKSDGTVWAWGLNENGQLGDGTTTDRLTPVQVQNLSDVISIAAGKDFSLALKQDGTVWAWGLNEYGQLGDGTATDSLTPVQVHDLTDIIEITAGMDFSLARNADGTVRAWGSNYNGQLGDNSTDDRYTPVDVLYLTDVMGIAAGGQHSLALQSDGTVWAWGLNQYGELGDNTVVDRHTPVQVDNLDNVIAIKSAFEESSVALKSDGTVWDWGNNNVGQLGDNTTTERHTPVQVQNMSNVITIAAGPQFCWAVKSDGTAWVWGSNYYGEFGDDSTIGSHVAVQKQNMGADVAFATGTIYSLALKPDGTAWTWGLNLHGALGDNTTTERHVPVRVHGPNNVGWF
jgi:alpha-tubulin suppressor-like RCC1 family protein